MTKSELAEWSRVLNENVMLRVAVSERNAALANMEAYVLKMRAIHAADLKEALAGLQSAMGVIDEGKKDREELMKLIKKYEVMMEESFRRPRLVAIP